MFSANRTVFKRWALRKCASCWRYVSWVIFLLNHFFFLLSRVFALVVSLSRSLLPAATLLALRGSPMPSATNTERSTPGVLEQGSHVMSLLSSFDRCEICCVLRTVRQAARKLGRTQGEKPRGGGYLAGEASERARTLCKPYTLLIVVSVSLSSRGISFVAGENRVTQRLCHEVLLSFFLWRRTTSSSTIEPLIFSRRTPG